MKNKTQAFKNLLIKLLGGCTQKEYDSIKKNLLHEASENERLRLNSERACNFLAYFVDSFHNFNYYNNDEFSSRIRIIIINLRLFTIYYQPNSEHILETLTNEEFKKLTYLIEVILHKAINSFEISIEEFEKFNCFFCELKEKYDVQFFILECNK